MSHLNLVLATSTVCLDFRAFRLTLVGFWASRLMIRMNMMTYRLLQTRSPSYLFDRFQLASSTRTMNLIVPRYNTTHKSSSFFVRGVSNWNAVPPVIKMKGHVKYH
jgi:hypothetical protein